MNRQEWVARVAEVNEAMRLENMRRIEGGLFGASPNADALRAPMLVVSTWEFWPEGHGRCAGGRRVA